jgi:tripartite-type tricarboxylate transporter receptor subunit TctC
VPDGHTLMYTPASTLAQLPQTMLAVKYDPMRDFTPIAQCALGPVVLVLHKSVPAASVGELIAHAKKHPGELNYVSQGVGTSAHIFGQMLRRQAGIDIVHVPYKSSAQSVTDMITGRLDMQFATIAPSLPNIQAGQLRALATSGKTRVAVLPEVPTVAEAGIAGYEAALWVAVVAPAATSTTIVARLNRVLNEILKSPEGTDAIIAQGMTAEVGTPEAVTQRIRTDIVKWRDVAAKAGIRPE